MRLLRDGAALLLVVTLPATTSAQEATPAPPPEPSAAEAQPAGQGSKAIIEETLKAEELVLSGKGGYNYDPAGRRDPFVDPLSAKGPGGEDEKPRPEGWPGMLIGEVKLEGITVYGGEPIAIFMGTDGVGYFAREGDELWDGKIIAIDFEEGKVEFQQKVEDPSSPIRFRNVEKKLNP